MSASNFGQIYKAIPTDGEKIQQFNYMQVGVSGDVAIKFKSGAVVTISSGLLDRMSIVPVGAFDEVLSTGTTASDIYVW